MSMLLLGWVACPMLTRCIPYISAAGTYLHESARCLDAGM